MQLNVDLNEMESKHTFPRHVHWAPDAKDNEMLNKKKSKACCIYRKPQPFGESSSESGESSCDSPFSSKEPSVNQAQTQPCGFMSSSGERVQNEHV